MTTEQGPEPFRIICRDLSFVGSVGFVWDHHHLWMTNIRLLIRLSIDCALMVVEKPRLKRLSWAIRGQVGLLYSLWHLQSRRRRYANIWVADAAQLYNWSCKTEHWIFIELGNHYLFEGRVSIACICFTAHKLVRIKLLLVLTEVDILHSALNRIYSLCIQNLYILGFIAIFCCFCDKYFVYSAFNTSK